MYRFEYFQSRRNSQWYWRLVASNGKTVADGSEGYSTKHACSDAINRVKRNVPSASAHEVTS